METEESQISVWVCREEKVVFGLSRRTTCADVVRVLLRDRDSQPGLSAARTYCIVEKWRGFERVLPNRTKVLRLWAAWGEERGNVKFVLVRSEASLASRGARSAEARVVLSKQSPGVAEGGARDPPPAGGVSPEKQRRIVRKAFRKLEKINKKRARAAHRDASCAERMETLVHLVVSQDHTIRQQVQRIAELDAEIERCEAAVHLDRIKRHGVNYVQDTYLVDAAAAAAAAAARGREDDARCSPETLAAFEEYVRRCEEVVRLQEELWEQEALADSVAAQVQEELNHRWMQRRTEALRGSGDARGPVPDAALLEEEEEEEEDEEDEEEQRVKTQLDASLYIGLRLDTDLEAVRSDLELARELRGAREREMRELMERVNTLDVEDGTAGEETGGTCALEGKSAWVEQARGLSKARGVNDDDSDTGLSSLHSQDSDGLPVWESLV